MAIFRTKSANAALFIILCVLILQEGSDAASLDIHSRKVLGASKRLEILKGAHGSIGGGNGDNQVSRELRTAPSGPDPLHHNGGSPKKPRTPGM